MPDERDFELVLRESGHDQPISIFHKLLPPRCKGGWQGWPDGGGVFALPAEIDINLQETQDPKGFLHSLTGARPLGSGSNWGYFLKKGGDEYRIHLTTCLKQRRILLADR